MGKVVYVTELSVRDPGFNPRRAQSTNNQFWYKLLVEKGRGDIKNISKAILVVTIQTPKNVKISHVWYVQFGKDNFRMRPNILKLQQATYSPTMTVYDVVLNQSLVK